MTGTLTILRENRPLKEAVFTSVAAIAKAQFGLKPAFRRGQGWQRQGYPETADRVADAMARAKRQPRGLLRLPKRALITGQYNWARGYFSPGDMALCWNGLTGSRRAYMQGARDAGAARLFAELAPFKGYVTLDPHGLNAESSVPQTKAGLGDQPLSAARQAVMADALTARAARKTHVLQDARELPDGPFLFCPLQVPNDSQITVFGGWAGSVPGFIGALAHAARHLPEGWHLRVKEHPSARASMAGPLEAAQAVSQGRLVVDNTTDTFDQVRAAQGVVTINSSLALESMILNKPVITTGQAYFAKAGLVTPAQDQDHLNALCSAPQMLTYDAAHRSLLLGYLLDRYFVPMESDHTLDAPRVAEKIAQSQEAT